MKTLVSIGLMVLLAGCATPASFFGLDAEQIAAMAKVKDASVVCATGSYAIARGLAVFAAVDKGISATVTVRESCNNISITTTTGKPVSVPLSGVVSP